MIDKVEALRCRSVFDSIEELLLGGNRHYRLSHYGILSSEINDGLGQGNFVSNLMISCRHNAGLVAAVRSTGTVSLVSGLSSISR